jgi:hypothetical protein
MFQPVNIQEPKMEPVMVWLGGCYIELTASKLSSVVVRPSSMYASSLDMIHDNVKKSEVCCVKSSEAV